MVSESDHLDAFTRLSEMELLQDSVHCKLKTAHARCKAGTTQESMMPISRHFYPKWKKKDPTCRNMWRNLFSPPYHHVGLWWTKPKRVNHGPYKETCPFGHHHMQENSWAWMDIFPTVIKCHSKCFVKMMGLLMTTLARMMNALHLLRMKVNKIEGCLTMLWTHW